MRCRAITLTHSMGCHPECAFFLSYFHLALFLPISPPSFASTFLPPPPLVLLKSLMVPLLPPHPLLSTVPPCWSTNYPQIKIYADSLMNPDPLNAAWAHSWGRGQPSPTCDISMLSFIGRQEINHQARGRRCATA